MEDKEILIKLLEMNFKTSEMKNALDELLTV